jgi:hypothetical protein
MDGDYTVADVCRKFNVARETIRRWEELHWFPTSALHAPRAGPVRLPDSGGRCVGPGPKADPGVQSRRRSLTERGEEGSRETGCPFLS